MRKCQKKVIKKEGGHRFSSQSQKAGSTQMSNMKGIVNILWNCHGMVHYAAYKAHKELYELSKPHVIVFWGGRLKLYIQFDHNLKQTYKTKPQT